MQTLYQPRTILVTGGAGFIGSRFIHHVLTQKSAIRIINLDKLTYAASLQHLKHFADHERYHFIHGDIIDKPLIHRILREFQVDTIVHFAAESHVDRSITGPGLFITTNILGTYTLLEAAKSYWLDEKKLSAHECRFHHISTDEVFGSLQLNDSAFTESTAYHPNSPYSASKASSDHLVNAYHHTYGLPISLSNCSNNYGPNQHAEKFIPTVIQACLARTPIPIYGTGTNIRDWLYVDDHCLGIMRILKQGKNGCHYNIGGNNECSNLQLTEIICKKFDELRPHTSSHLKLIKFVTDRPGHDFRYAIDNSKIKAELQWEPQFSLEHGLHETIQYYLSFHQQKQNECIL